MSLIVNFIITVEGVRVMFLGLPWFVWFVVCIALIGVIIVILGWYVAYCVFDWGVHYVKHVWEDEDESTR